MILGRWSINIHVSKSQPHILIWPLHVWIADYSTLHKEKTMCGNNWTNNILCQLTVAEKFIFASGNKDQKATARRQSFSMLPCFLRFKKNNTYGVLFVRGCRQENVDEDQVLLFGFPANIRLRKVWLTNLSFEKGIQMNLLVFVYFSKQIFFSFVPTTSKKIYSRFTSKLTALNSRAVPENWTL